MKKCTALIFATLALAFSYAEESSLYDVNYDPPKQTANYDETLQAFQNIYLQYESAVRTSEIDIRTNEQTIRQNEKMEERLKAQAELEAALKEQREEIYATEIENLRTQEREKLTAEIHEQLSAELTEKFTKEYEEKKNAEVAALEKELRETISLKNEKLKEQYKIEVRNELTEEYENKKSEEVKIAEAELRAAISLENENLKTQYKAEVRNELESEYESKKNAELKVLAEQQYEDILQKTNATTERYKILSPYIFALVFGVIALIAIRRLVKFISKVKSEKVSEQERAKNMSDLIKYYADTYLNELKRFDGKTAVFGAIKVIREKIENSTESEYQKSIRRFAIGKAQEEYNQYKATLPVSEYKKLFEDFGEKAKKIFDRWNEGESRMGLCNDFNNNVNKYTENAIEAYKSKNTAGDIKNMFARFAPTLENTAEQVKNLAENESDNSLKIKLVSISEKYSDLAKKFAKGEFLK